MSRIAGEEYRRRDEERRWAMALWVGVGIGLGLALVGVYVGKRLHGRPRTLAGRWAAHNGYVYRQDDRVHLFVQGPPFDRGDGVIERALLVGSCAGRPSLITHFGWHDGDPARPGGSCVALVLELPDEVAPLQLDHVADSGAEFAYRVTCDSPDLVRAVLTPRAKRALMAVPHDERVNVRLDGTAMIVWVDAELTSARRFEVVHDVATELYRLIPRSVFASAPAAEQSAPPPPPPRDGVRPVDVHGRPGEVREEGGEVLVSLPTGAAWPRLSILAYEWMADQYHATTFDKPDPSAHPLVDIMFAVRSADDNFRRKVLVDLADWLPIDERTRRCGVLLDEDGRITAHAPGDQANATLVALLTDVVHEVGQRLSADTYRHGTATVP